MGSEGVEQVSPVGSEGVEGATAGGGVAAISPVTTAALVCLHSSSWVSWPLRVTSLLLLRSTISLKLQRKSAPRMGKATGACRKLHVNCLVLVRMVHVRRPQQRNGVPSDVTRRRPVGSVVCRCVWNDAVGAASVH